MVRRGDQRVAGQHAKRKVLVEDEVARTLQRGDDGCRAGARRGDRHDDGGAAASGGDRHLLDLGRSIGRHRAVDRDAQRIVAGRGLGIDDVEAQPRGIAHRHEARQGAGHDNRIAHDDIGRGMADLGLAPGDSHDAHGAVEGRDIEVDRGGAVVLHLDDAGILAERLLGRRRSGKGRTAIATGAQLAALALHAVDQHAVDVAQFGRQPLLVEVIVLRCGRIVAGEIEDADIDGGNRDEGLFAGGQIADLHGNGQLLARLHDLGRRQLDIERARGTVDAEPGKAHGA